MPAGKIVDEGVNGEPRIIGQIPDPTDNPFHAPPCGHAAKDARRDRKGAVCKSSDLSRGEDRPADRPYSLSSRHPPHLVTSPSSRAITVRRISSHILGVS